MSLEIYWKKALEQTRLSIDDESLYPLKTDIITSDLYQKNDFVIRKLDTSKFNKKKFYHYHFKKKTKFVITFY